MNTKILNGLAAASTLVSLVMGSGAAYAASLSYTASLDPTKTDILNYLLSVNKFDPSYGTLDSVLLELTTQIQTQAEIVNTGITASTIKYVELGGQVRLDDPLDIGPKPVLNIALTPVSRTNLVVKAGETIYIPEQINFATGTDTDSISVTSGDFFNSFIGSGSRQFSFSALGIYGVLGPANLNTTVTTLADGNLKVTYNYTPKPVPEPSAMLGFGVIAGLGLLSGSKKSWVKFSKS